MAKKDDNKGLPKFEDWLAPWEVDDDGNKLDEPVEIDAARLKKHLYNLLSDKTRLQETVADRDVQLAEKDDALKELQRQHENEEQTREREAKEREQRYAKLEAEAAQRRKIEAIEEAFEEQGITPAQARKLAKRVSGDDESSWVEDARELVEDGFKIGSKTQSTEQVLDEDREDDLTARPIPRRGTGQLAEPKPTRKKSVVEEMEAAGLFPDRW